MTIQTYVDGEEFGDVEDGFKNIRLHVTGEDVKQFQELIQRGSNLWPDAPPQIKHMADIITNGRPMQDYFAQQDFKKSGLAKIPLNLCTTPCNESERLQIHCPNSCPRHP